MFRSLSILVVFFYLPMPTSADYSRQWYMSTGEGRECELYVQERGRGQTVVVLHGGPGHSHTYLEQAFEDFYSDYHFVYYDQRGALLSPCDESLISLENNVADLDKLRSELDRERIFIVSHSAGAHLALSYLRAHSDRVAGLILTGSTLLQHPTPEEWKNYLSGNERRMALRVEQVEAQIAAEGLDRDDLTDKELSHLWRIRFASSNLRDVRRWREIQGGRVFYNQVVGEKTTSTYEGDRDFVPELKAFSNRFTVIHGDQEILGMESYWQRMKSLLPNLNHVVLPNAGHASWIEAREGFNQTIANSLARYE